MPALQYLASFSQVKGVILILQVRKLRFSVVGGQLACARLFIPKVSEPGFEHELRSPWP